MLVAGINTVAAANTVIPVNPIVNSRNLDCIILAMRNTLGAIAAGLDIDLMINYRYIDRVLRASV